MMGGKAAALVVMTVLWWALGPASTTAPDKRATVAGNVEIATLTAR